MKVYKHICRICGNEFYTDIKSEYLCCRECKRIYYAQKTAEKARRQRETRETVFDIAYNEYTAYCAENGFVTYGKYKAMKTAEALKQKKEVKENET